MRIKIVENPEMNNKEWKIVAHLSLDLLSVPVSSWKETPVI
jgi:hypothetical protein